MVMIVKGLRPRIGIVSIAALAFVSCGYAFEITPPSSFLELEDQDPTYALRATSAEGLVLAVRELDNDPYGGMAFWETAVSNELRYTQGYSLLDTTEVRAASGELGTLLEFGRDDATGSYLYSIALFVNDDYIWVVEIGGDEELYQTNRAALDQSLSSFRVD